MISKLGTPVSPATALLDSDAFYFDLAAQRLLLAACEIAYVPDLISLPVSCVAQRVNEKLACENPKAFVAELEAACVDLGAPLARLYLHENAVELESELLAQGYQSKVEIGFLAKPTGANEHRIADNASLRQVVSEADWRDKLDVHRQEDVGSDGYRNHAFDWNEMMYRKYRTGFKDTFLIEYHGTPVGTVAIVESPGIRRLKNLFVVPTYRGLGLAFSAVHLLLAQAELESIPLVGVFGIEGSPGCSVYQSCGFEPATRQVEYTKRLSNDSVRRIPLKHPR